MINLRDKKTGDRVWVMLETGSVKDHPVARMVSREPSEVIYLQSGKSEETTMFVGALVSNGNRESFEALKAFDTREEAILAAVEYIEIQIAKLTDGLRRYVEMLPEDHERRKGE
jgi:hypothetical protein